IFITARAMDRSEDLQSLFDCIYQVYDLEGIPYQRTVFTLDQNPIDDSNGIDF
ncbi:LysR family transcriptional regulator, partial [Acinetobacter baumannii]